MKSIASCAFLGALILGLATWGSSGLGFGVATTRVFDDSVGDPLLPLVAAFEVIVTGDESYTGTETLPHGATRWSASSIDRGRPLAPCS